MSRARTSRLRRAFLVLASLAAASLLAEGAHRVYLFVRGVPHDAAHVRELLEGSVEPLRAYQPSREAQPGPETAGADPILHPFTGGEFWHDTGDVLEYFRGPRSVDAFEVLIVGGSVASLFAETEARALEADLRRAPELAGRHVRVLNYAHIAYKQPQQLNRVTWLLTLGAHPEVVLNLDGFNEIALSVEQAASGTHPLYPYRVVWGLVARDAGFGSIEDVRTLARIEANRADARAWLDRALGWHVEHSSVLSTLAYGRLCSLQRQREALTRELQSAEAVRAADAGRLRQVTGPDYDVDRRAVLALSIEGWFRASCMLDATCRTFDIEYVHALQPALFDRDSKPMSESERRLEHTSSGAWVTAPRYCYPILRERGQDLARRGVAFVDLSRVFEKEVETRYRDPVHVDARGNALVREALLPEILAAVRRAAR